VQDSSALEYFRGDQADGISPPDLSKDVGYVDHIVKARGKRTQFTSVSRDRAKIRDFGEQLYKLRSLEVVGDGHQLVEHEALMAELRRVVQSSERAERLKAIQAARYAEARVEGLVRWSFDIGGVPPKNLLTWASGKVRPYFTKA